VGKQANAIEYIKILSYTLYAIENKIHIMLV